MQFCFSCSLKSFSDFAVKSKRMFLPNYLFLWQLRQELHPRETTRAPWLVWSMEKVWMTSSNGVLWHFFINIIIIYFLLSYQKIEWIRLNRFVLCTELLKYLITYVLSHHFCTFIILPYYFFIDRSLDIILLIKLNEMPVFNM